MWNAMNDDVRVMAAVCFLYEHEPEALYSLNGNVRYQETRGWRLDVRIADVTSCCPSKGNGRFGRTFRRR
jgi:hypothetical protein